MIYAKNGILVDNQKQKVFRLFDGKVINIEKSKINVFEFDQIDFNLNDFTSNTIVVPKIQEISTLGLLGCFFSFKVEKFEAFNCDKSMLNKIKQELLKRLYTPIYIPVIGILCCFLIAFSKSNLNYNRNRNIIFLLTFIILVFSETSLRYSTSSIFSMSVYFLIPWIILILAYTIFCRKTKNV